MCRRLGVGRRTEGDAKDVCGICGIVGEPSREALGRMASAMVHRGPDDQGYYIDDYAGLGFRRLSIIDVSGGHQPLANEDASLQLVFNGEIYNHRQLRAQLERQGHRFRTDSDGEVILHLYEERGIDLVDALNGIFAFALWDREARELVLARDQHGVKPLYYATLGRTFLFASELKGLLATGRLSREIDMAAVQQFLVYQAVPPPLSILKAVRALPPGRVAVHKNGELRQHTYWTPPCEAAEPIEDRHQATALVRDGLTKAVARQMMSERPLGVFLSGGVDSSALVALAAQNTGHRLKTFSVGFEGPDETIFTEWPWARLVADRYHTDHQEFVLTEPMFSEAMPRTLVAMDQPTADGINSYWVSYAAARHVTVALSGTGADELLLGYGRDDRLLAHHQRHRHLGWLPAHYLRWVANAIDRVNTADMWPAAADAADAVRAHARLDAHYLSPAGIAMFGPEESRAVLRHTSGMSGDVVSRAAAAFVRDVAPDPAKPGDWLSRLEQRAYLSYVLLRDIDAMSMAHSLEVRVPFLDRELGDLLAKVPWQMKYRGGVGKWILKEALRPLVPADVLDRTKMGFGLPIGVWMRRSLEPMVRDMLDSSRVARRGVFDAASTERLVRRFYDGDDGAWRQVWMLFVFEGWATQVLDAGRDESNAAAA